MTKQVIKYSSLFFLLFLNVFLDLNINNYIFVLSKCFNKTIILPQKYIVLISAIFALISTLIYLAILLVAFGNKEAQKGIKLKTNDGTYGTANWSTNDEAQKILGLNNEPGILFGKKDNRNVVLPFNSHFNKNILVIGSSGSMKSIGFILPNILQLAQYNKSMIITDPKGELYKKTSCMLKNRGYTVKVFNLCNMSHSDRWNPLSEIENINDAQNTADIIISNTQKHKKSSDDFWPRAEENLLKAFILYFKEKMIETNSLADIYLRIAGRDITEIESMFNSLHQDSPARMSYNIFAQGSDTVKASVLTGLGTRLQAFQNELVQKVTSETDIDLTLPAKQKCAYFVITSDMDGGTYDFLSSLFYTFLFIKLVRYADSRPNGKCDIDVFLLLDEFANIGAIPDFEKKISTTRSRSISIIPVIQNVAQLKNRYPADIWQEIVGNCDIRVMLGCTDIMTADYISNLLGVATAENISIRKDSGIDGELQYGQKNISSTQRKLLNSDEILRLPMDKMIIVLRGNKPYLIDKKIYTEHPLAKELKDNSVNEYVPGWQLAKKKVFREIKKENQNIKGKISFKNF